MKRGRPPAWTREQREQVLAFADQGMSQRAIAERVFGDARYRGRVERILRERTLARDLEPTQEDAPAGTVDEGGEAVAALDVSGVRRLVSRFERSLEESGETPSLADIERLLRIKRQLDAMETIERVRALTRDRR